MLTKFWPKNIKGKKPFEKCDRERGIILEYVGKKLIMKMQIRFKWCRQRSSTGLANKIMYFWIP